MSGFVPLIELSRCRKNSGTFVEQNGRELAVFRFGEPEHVVVIDNACPHASGNLSGGAVHEGVVTCPWHQWSFDLSTGQCTRSPDVQVRQYGVRVEDGIIYLDISTL